MTCRIHLSSSQYPGTNFSLTLRSFSVYCAIAANWASTVDPFRRAFAQELAASSASLTKPLIADIQIGGTS